MGEPVLSVGQRWGGYAVSVVTALLTLSAIASVLNANAYMGSAFVMLAVTILALPIAMVSLAWIPLGARYATALTADRDRMAPPATVVLLGLAVAVSAGVAGGLFMGRDLSTGVVVGASMATGCAAYMISCWWSVRPGSR